MNNYAPLRIGSRPYCVTYQTRNQGTPQTSSVIIYAYDLDDAWAAAKRAEYRSLRGNYDIVVAVYPICGATDNQANTESL